MFFGISLVFVYRSFYGMRIESAGLASKNEGVKAAIESSGAISVRAFLMFFFAVFAFVATLAFAAYARTYPMQDNYRTV